MIHGQVKLKIEKKHFKINKPKYDKTKRRREFKIGDMDFVHSGNQLKRNKLDEIRKGSFKILERISNSIYEVNNVNGKSGGNFFHSSNVNPHGDYN